MLSQASVQRPQPEDDSETDYEDNVKALATMSVKNPPAAQSVQELLEVTRPKRVTWMKSLSVK